MLLSGIRHSLLCGVLPPNLQIWAYSGFRDVAVLLFFFFFFSFLYLQYFKYKIFYTVAYFQGIRGNRSSEGKRASEVH